MTVKDTDRKLHVLVAAKDEMSRIFLCETIEDSGCTCKTAEHGRTALDLFLEERFDVVFLTEDLPGMNGYEMARAIRELDHENSEHTPMALMIAGQHKEEERNPFTEDLDYQLFLPCEKEEIRRILSRIAAENSGTPSEEVQPDSEACSMDSGIASDLAEKTENGDYLSLEEMCSVFEKNDCDTQFLETLLANFNDSAAELFEKIRECISYNDFDALSEFAHALRGEFYIFNAAVPIRIAEALERVSRTGCIPQNAEAVVGKLEADVREIIKSYTEFLNRISRQEK